MPVSIISSVTQPKIAPKDIQCSRCGRVVKQGRVYVKTNGGRYCEPCADFLEELKPIKVIQ